MHRRELHEINENVDNLNLNLYDTILPNIDNNLQIILNKYNMSNHNYMIESYSSTFDKIKINE